jgi:hypothetical protein
VGFGTRAVQVTGLDGDDNVAAFEQKLHAATGVEPAQQAFAVTDWQSGAVEIAQRLLGSNTRLNTASGALKTSTS